MFSCCWYGRLRDTMTFLLVYHTQSLLVVMASFTVYDKIAVCERTTLFRMRDEWKKKQHVHYRNRHQTSEAAALKWFALGSFREMDSLRILRWLFVWYWNFFYHFFPNFFPIFLKKIFSIFSTIFFFCKFSTILFCRASNPLKKKNRIAIYFKHQRGMRRFHLDVPPLNAPLYFEMRCRNALSHAHDSLSTLYVSFYTNTLAFRQMRTVNVVRSTLKSNTRIRCK